MVTTCADGWVDGWMDGFEGLESRPLLGRSLSLGQVHRHRLYLCHAGQF
jgi:hypothetical protein